MSITELPQQKNKILILEEGELQSQLYIHSLSEIGFHAVLIQDASTINNAIAEHEPTLLIVTGSQLNVDPITHIKYIRKTFTDIPIIIAMFDTNQSNIIDAFNAGATDYTKMPINWGILSHKIDRCINGYEMKDFYGNKIKYTLHETIKTKINASNSYVVSLFVISDNGERITDNNRIFTLRDSFREQIKNPACLDSSQEYFLHICKGVDSVEQARSQFELLSNHLSVFNNYTIQFCAFYFNKEKDREVDLKMFIEDAVNRILNQGSHGKFSYIGDNGQSNIHDFNVSA